jgi:hypothetical protein
MDSNSRGRRPGSRNTSPRTAGRPRTNAHRPSPSASAACVDRGKSVIPGTEGVVRSADHPPPARPGPPTSSERPSISCKHDATPLNQGAAPCGHGATPLNQGAAPFRQGAAPLNQGAAPFGQGATPLNQGAAPFGQGAARSSHRTHPAAVAPTGQLTQMLLMGQPEGGGS